MSPCCLHFDSDKIKKVRHLFNDLAFALHVNVCFPASSRVRQNESLINHRGVVLGEVQHKPQV